MFKRDTKVVESEANIIVPFLMLETKHFSFGDVKLNKYRSNMVNIKYKGKNLYVKYPDEALAPFGVNSKTSLEDDTKVKTTDSKITGYDISYQLNKDYMNPEDPHHEYFLKAKELDDFFIQKALENRISWLSMVEDDEKFALKRIRGSDEYGFNGIYKQLLKVSRKKEKNSKGIKEVQMEYAPRINNSFMVKISDTEKSETGKFLAEFNTDFYDGKTGEKIDGVNQDNIELIVPKYCKQKLLVRWSRFTCSTAWMTLKSEIKQIIIHKRDDFDSTINYLQDDDDEPDTLVLDGPDFGETTAAAPAGAGSSSKFADYDKEVEDDEEIVEDKPKVKVSTKPRI